MRSAAIITLAAGFAAAGVVPAQGDVETVYSTQLVTITSCGPEVGPTDCPAESTKVTSKVWSSTKAHDEPEITPTPECPGCDKPEKPEEPVYPPPGDEKPEEPEHPEKPDEPEEPVYPPPGDDEPEYPVSEPIPEPTEPVVIPPPEECVPTTSVKTIHTEVTTVIPTVIYETIDIPCETAPVEPPHGGDDKPPHGGDDKPPHGGEEPPHGGDDVPPPPAPPVGGNETVPIPPPSESQPVEAGAAGISASVLFAGAAALFAYFA